MTPTISSDRSPPPPEVPAIVRSIHPRDVLWNRPLFKAPPLRIKPLVPSAKDFASESTLLGGQR